jgi:hypothetical protein
MFTQAFDTVFRSEGVDVDTPHLFVPRMPLPTWNAGFGLCEKRVIPGKIPLANSLHECFQGGFARLLRENL